MHLVLSCDKNYIQNLYVVICSISTNAKSSVLPTIWLLSEELGDEEEHAIKAFSLRAGIVVKFIRPSFESSISLKIDGHVSVATYYRLFLSEFLPHRLHRVIYLDLDMLILDDLVTLWETDLQGRSIAAVQEPGMEDRFRLFGLPVQDYFNAGVLLIDLDKWRTLNVPARVAEIMKEHYHHLHYWDQDVLNILFAGQWKKLDAKWNVTTAYFKSENKQRVVAPYFAVALKDPAVIHFSASIKPWQFRSRHPFKRLYYHYLRQTPFKHYRPPDRSVYSWLRRTVGYVMDMLNG
jgi:lipopolysaccharide biosynthesis glycosyltransferase